MKDGSPSALGTLKLERVGDWMQCAEGWPLLRCKLDTHRGQRDHCNQLLCPPTETLPGVIPASGDFRPVTELRWEQKGSGGRLSTRLPNPDFGGG